MEERAFTGQTVMPMLEEEVRKIVKLGDTYKKEHLLSKYDKNLILDNWWEALNFYFDRSFMRGRNDELSAEFEHRAITALEGCLGADLRQKEEKLGELNKDGLLNKTKFKDEHNPLQRLLKDAEVNHHGDRLMVINTLSFISGLDERNIVKWTIQKIRDGKIEEAYKQIDGIEWIGDKLASFFIRDVVDLFDLEHHLSLDDHKFTQPIDTWVQQVSVKLGIISEELSRKKTLSKKELREIKEGILKACNQFGVSPIKFNQGAWYYGARGDII